MTFGSIAVTLLNRLSVQYPLPFKYPPIVFTDTLHFNFTVALPNNNNNNNNNKKKKKKKKMEKFGYIAKCQKLLKRLSKVPAIVQITKQHLKDILKDF